MLPTERDTVIDDLDDVINKMRLRHATSRWPCPGDDCDTCDEIETLRVAAAVLADLRDA